MMIKHLTLAAALASIAVPVGAAPRMTLEQAVELCTERAKRYARMPQGRLGEEPPRARVLQDYRHCVFANSHRYPVAPPKYRDSILTTLRDAANQ